MKEILNKVAAKLLALKEKIKPELSLSKEGQERDRSGINLRRQQYLFMFAIIALLIVASMAIIVIKNPLESSAPTIVDLKPKTQQEGLNIQLATSSVKGDKKWQSYLEDKIDKAEEEQEKKMKLIEESLSSKDEQIQDKQNKLLAEINTRLSYLLNEQERLQLENKEIRAELLDQRNQEEVILPAELSMQDLIEEDGIVPPVSSWNYIPATSYVSGNLLGGVVVSTSVRSSSEPIPVVIRLTNKGNLPKDFAVDLKQCRILGSAYGDISSERAIIRAEELVCENKQEGLVGTTRIAGVVYGDDGMNGIHGSVVSMGDKHLKNAFVSGVLSGFSNSVKGDGAFNISALGAIRTDKRGMSDIAKESVLGGVSSASEKLADYHIKLAENISPVILVPGGTKVDIMFTKGVRLGSIDTHESIKKQRKKHN